MSMSYRREPLAKALPNLPIPGQLPINGSRGRPLPPYQGQIYTSSCKLWSITFEMIYQYYYLRVDSLAVAEVIFHKLLGWANDLQEGVNRGEYTSDGATNLQYCYP